MQPESFLLWENDTFKVVSPSNPHTPKEEGIHLVVLPKQELASAWENTQLSSETFALATKACKTLERIGFGDWFNIQTNGNWGLRPGKTPRFHVHIYARVKDSATWGRPVRLPELPGTFQHEPLSAAEQLSLSQALENDL